ncbi:uncharacterized protein LOC127239284 [Andrographis paniculata]|uniref:uncharacterized protein LOC127239284 n=1 Tax=Andrographis paniculata TaxID=175694 RepID=UPI0021E91CEA|nr:uncharacterized protein LOC127239284 [Andrographis paniculata]
MWNAPTPPWGCHGPNVANLQRKRIIETQRQGGQSAEMQPPTFYQQAAGIQPLTSNQQETKPLMNVDVITNWAETPDVVEALVEKKSAEIEVLEAMEAPELVGAESPEAVKAPVEKESAEAEVLEAMEALELVEASIEKESAEAEVPEAMEAPELVEAETPEAVEAPVQKESAEAEVPEAMEAPKFAEAETPGTVETPNKKDDVRAEAPYEKDSLATEPLNNNGASSLGPKDCCLHRAEDNNFQ